MIGGTAGGVPAYRRVGDELAARIRSGELAPGARVPSERELAAGQGITRMTARAAVGLLARRGLVERRERSGVFVARPKIEQSLDTVAGLSDQLGGRGVVPGAEVIEERTVRAGELGDAEVASRLGLSEEDAVYVIVRVRTGDGEPLVLEENYLPEGCCRGCLRRISAGACTLSCASVTASLWRALARNSSPPRSTLGLRRCSVSVPTCRRSGSRAPPGTRRGAHRVRQGPPPRGPNDLRLRHLGSGGRSHPLIPAPSQLFPTPYSPLPTPNQRTYRAPHAVTT